MQSGLQSQLLPLEKAQQCKKFSMAISFISMATKLG
jgi:hypothetical protein